MNYGSGINGSQSVRKSLRIQARVIGALLMREIVTRYGRHNIGFLWLFVEPMLFTLGISTLWAFAGLKHSTEISIVAFAVTGYSAVLLWRNMPARCIGAILPNQALMYHRNVRVMDIFLSRVLLEAAGATVSFVVLGTVLVALNQMKPPENILLLMSGWFLLAWFGAGFAILLGALAERTEIVEKLWHPMSYIIMPLSGIAFVVDALPIGFRDAVLWIPMVNATEMIRDGYFGSTFTAHYSVGYLLGACIAVTLLALLQERAVSSRIELE